MNIIVIGVGKVGYTLVESLSKEGHDIVVIDTNPKAVEVCVNRYDVRGFVGSGFERELLEESGVAKADFVISITATDEFNVLTCMLAKKLGAKYTIARVRDPGYFNEIKSMSGYLDIDFALNPEYYTAQEISNMLKFPSANNMVSFAGGKADMVEFDVDTGNTLIGKTVKEIKHEFNDAFLFVTVKRKDKAFIPHGDFVIEEGDVIFILGDDKEIQSFAKKLKIYKPHAKSVFIIGGGKIGYYLAKRLVKSGISVKILERDEERCRFLADEIPEATVLCGDGSDQDVLAEEDLKNSDACVSLTGMDEENVIVSLYAQQLKVDKVIAKVDRPSILAMVKELGLDSTVSARYVTANHVLKFVRSHSVEQFSSDTINKLYKINEHVEAIDFTVEDNFLKKDIPIKDLKVRANVIVAGIVRDNTFITPNGDTVIKSGDRVLVVANSKQIRKLEEIFK